MDFIYFIKVLLKRKWLLLLVTIIATLAAYYIAEQKTVTYKTGATVATGIINSTGPLSNQGSNYIQPLKIENRFSNIIEVLYSRGSMKVMSYRLLHHDLTSSYSFREADGNVPTLSGEQKTEVIQFLETEIEDIRNALEKESITNYDSNENGTGQLVQMLLNSYGYNYEALRPNVSVKRTGTTDFLRVEMTGENPRMVAFAVNNYCEDFIETYTNDKLKNSNSSVKFFADITAEKKAALDEKTQASKEFKLSKSVVNLGEQSRAMVSQIRELELTREEEKQKIPSYEKALQSLDQHLTNNDNIQYRKRRDNTKLTQLKEEQRILIEQQVTDGKDDPRIAQRLEMVNKELQAAIFAADAPLSSKATKAPNEDLIEKKIDTEIELDAAKAKVASIDRELKRLRGKATGYVTSEAVLGELETEIKVLTEDYLSSLEKFETAKLEALSTTNLLSVIEPGRIPENPEPSKAAFLGLFAGMLAFTLFIVVLFVLAYLDLSINSPDKFNKFTNLRMIDVVNEVKVKDLDLEKLFIHQTGNAPLETFKQYLRNIRFEIEKSKSRVLLVTSAKEKEGKTFMIISLAYSLSLNNKKVLIIDTNFKNNTLSNMPMDSSRLDILDNALLIDKYKLTDHFVSTGTIFAGGQINGDINITNGGVDMIGTKKGELSPSEIFAGKNFQQFLTEMLERYDYIFLEGASLNEYPDTKELATYADKIIAVFSAQTEIKEEDRSALTYLQNLNGTFMGAVLNKVNLKNVS